MAFAGEVASLCALRSSWVFSTIECIPSCMYLWTCIPPPPCPSCRRLVTGLYKVAQAGCGDEALTVNSDLNQSEVPELLMGVSDHFKEDSLET